MTRPAAPRIWPLQPLLDLGHSIRHIQATCGIGGSELAAARTHGLTDAQADRLAVRLGHHPANIWPGWVAAGLGPLDHDYLASGWRQAWLHQETAA